MNRTELVEALCHSRCMTNKLKRNNAKLNETNKQLESKLAERLADERRQKKQRTAIANELCRGLSFQNDELCGSSAPLSKSSHDGYSQLCRGVDFTDLHQEIESRNAFDPRQNQMQPLLMGQPLPMGEMLIAFGMFRGFTFQQASQDKEHNWYFNWLVQKYPAKAFSKYLISVGYPMLTVTTVV